MSEKPKTTHGSPELDEDAKKLIALGADPGPTIEDLEGEWPKCPACGGRGTVNPLTAPKDFFCVGTTECHLCEGTGDCP